MHAYGASGRAWSAASRIESPGVSSTVSRRPARVNVTVDAGYSRAALAPSVSYPKNSSRWMCSGSTPRSISVSRTSAVSSIGPHRNHSSTVSGARSLASHRSSLSRSIRPHSVGGVERVAGEDVQDLEPVGVAGLELVELGAEHRRLARAVAVDQREPAVGLELERGLQHREDRGDAAADDDRDVVLAVERIERRAEPAGRGHHLEHVAGLQLLGDERRERAAGDVLDGDPQHRAGRGRADRVVAPDPLAAEVGLDGHVLAGLEAGTGRAAPRARAKVTSVLSAVIGSTDATGSR